MILRSLKLQNVGSKKEPNMMLRCEFSVSKNKYSKTYPVNIFQNSSLETIFTALCEDFNVDTEDELRIVDCKEEFTGEVFTVDVKPHFMKDEDGEMVKDKDGKPVIVTSLTAIYVEDFGQTKESVVRNYERGWEKQDLMCPDEEE
jgi:hypothetical protein